MEINVQEQANKINAEIYGLQQQLHQLEEQIRLVSQEIIRRQGIIMFLNNLDGQGEK